jgi:hypothetical protein
MFGKSYHGRAAVAAATIALAAPAALRAQDTDTDIVRQIEMLARENAPLYLGPITHGISAALSRGAFYSAEPHGALGFDIGIAAMAAWVPGFDDAFTPILPEQVTFDGRTFDDPYGTSAPSTPTVSGDGDGAVIQPGPELAAAAVAAGQDPSDLAIPFPRGLEVPLVPFAVVQAAVGLPGGTEVSLRGFPAVEVHEEVGAIGALGVGVTHSISQYLPVPVLDLSAHVSWQSANVGDYLDADVIGYGLIAGADAGPLSAFVAAVREHPEVTIGYTVSNPTGNPALPRDGLRVAAAPDLEAVNRFTAGATLNLIAFKLSGAWTSGDYQAVAIKALVSIR